MSDISFEKPSPKDFLGIDSLLSDEEKLLRDTVREYVEKEITPHVAEWREDGVIPHADLAKSFGEHLPRAPQPAVERIPAVGTEPGEEGHVMGPREHVHRVELDQAHPTHHPTEMPDVHPTRGRGVGHPWAARA